MVNFEADALTKLEAMYLKSLYRLVMLIAKVELSLNKESKQTYLWGITEFLYFLEL